MNLTRPVDIYCERLAPGFWAEPANALTNIAFILAAVLAWRLAGRQGVRDPALAVVIGLAALVGVASFLFHTFAVAWAGAADMGSIGLFMLGASYLALRRLFGFAPIWIFAGATGFAGAWFLSGALWPGGIGGAFAALGGSGLYGLGIAILATFALMLALRGCPAWKSIAAAGAVFLLSLYFRTIDGRICATFPLGAHFLWHLLNGFMFWIILRALIVHGRRPDRIAGDAR